MKQILSPASPDRITQLELHQVFVFASNTVGRHGLGSARTALSFGAEYGNPRGRMNQTYAIVTKDLSKGKRSIPLSEIESEIKIFLKHAGEHLHEEFLVTKIGCDLAGYKTDEIGNLWVGKVIPSNVRLPHAFIHVLESYS